MSIFDLNWLLSLILFSTILLGTPGPAVIALFHSGVIFGFKRTLPFFVRLILGFLFTLLLASVGVATLIGQETVFQILKYIMLGYIFYLSYKIATSKPLEEKVDRSTRVFFSRFVLKYIKP